MYCQRKISKSINISMKLTEIFTEATIKQEPPLNNNLNKVKPYLLTWNEYHQLVNPDDKWHSDQAYNFTLKTLNDEHDHKELLKFKQYQTKVIKGRSFTFYIRTIDRLDNIASLTQAQQDRYQDKRYNYEFKVVDDDTGMIVGSVQDEWGALLIVVAQEYRGFGLGIILGSLIRKFVPDYASGGLTNSGRNNLYKVYSSLVKSELAKGTYSKLVSANELSTQRAKEIINSANLSVKLPPSLEVTHQYENNKQDWVCMHDSDSDGFIIYNRKLILMYNNDDVSDFWKDEFIVGMGFASSSSGTDLVIFQFGGKDDTVKRLMMALIMTQAQQNRCNVRVEKSIAKYVDERKVELVTNRNYSKTELIFKPVSYSTSVSQLINADQRLRKKYDKYSQFEYWLKDTATAKYDDYL